MRARRSMGKMARTGLMAALATFAVGPALAGDPIAALFPDKSGCYGRSYSTSHLQKHTEQLVTSIALVPEGSVADPMIGLWVFVDLRGDIAGSYEGFAYCEADGAGLSCGMEGDAGSFAITPAEAGKILVEVGPYGMSFEGAGDFITLKSDRGDDRSFLLSPSPCS